mmetsp:Transcript_36186/g.75260  ORF Transcript_36186/g.75260 Transcript_36186/m.75260 type:complete len:85 (+) Transcript_36186:2564-2818(+)
MDFSAAMLDPSPLDSNFHVPMIFISIAMNQSADATPQLCPILVDKFILTIFGQRRKQFDETRLELMSQTIRRLTYYHSSMARSV